MSGFAKRIGYALCHLMQRNIRANQSYSPKVYEILLNIRSYGGIMKKICYTFCAEVKTMRASYKKLWKLLVDKDMSKGDLHKASGLSSSTMTKLRKGEDVSMEALRKICICLGCNIGDIVEFVDESK